MIRIDEIYTHTFRPWFERNQPDFRIFFCDPPGRTDPDALFNLSCNGFNEKDYVFFHDQEPIWMDLHRPLFDDVIRRNRNFEIVPGGHVVVSERGEFVDELCNQYGWKPHYYFYHAWACLDWYRGYDHSFLIPRAQDRRPTRTFMSPNRIIAGKRDHRVLFLYHVYQRNLQNNHISAPRTCTYENVDIQTVTQRYCNIYPDIEQVLTSADLPRTFLGEESQQMASCWLTNFYEAEDSLVYVPTETVYFGRRTHLTEKTFKAIALEMPFVLVAPAGSLEYLREYGFKTFAHVFDESYDTETDDIKRLEKISQLLSDLDSLSWRERMQIHKACLSTVQHNYKYFYSKKFSDLLWKELMGMLDEFRI